MAPSPSSVPGHLSVSSVDKASSTRQSQANEDVVLLSNPAEHPVVPVQSKVSYMNLPHKSQLAIMCLARCADPLAATSIQSYIVFQLSHFDPSASAATIASQAGLLFGAKTAAQTCTGMLWGRLADSEWGGRKAVLVMGLLSSAISIIGFGFAQSFPAAIAWQVFGGLMNCNVSMVRCVVAELNPEKRYRTRALLLLPLCANAGMLLGPLVGGLLVVQSDTGFFSKYPVALPNLVIASIDILALLGVVFGLRETLESLRHEKESPPVRIWNKVKEKFGRGGNSRHEYTAIYSEPNTPITPNAANSSLSRASSTPMARKKAKLPFWRIWTFNVCCTMLAHFIIAGHLATFSSLWAVFISNKVGSPSAQNLPFGFTGGLGMEPRDVGFAMAFLGAGGVVLQAAVYPMLNDRWGTVLTWRFALYVFPVVYILAPFPSLVASYSRGSVELGNDIEHGFEVWLSMAIILLLFTLGRSGVTPATTLLINDCTPHPSVRATIHTAGSVIGSLSRSLFPVIALAIFGKGLEIGVVGLAFWCLAGLAVLACVASRWVTEGSNGKEIQLPEDVEETEPSDTAGVVRQA